MKSAFLGKPILRVFHEADGDWQYLTEDPLDPRAAEMVHQSHVVALDPTLQELSDLLPGTWAERADASSDWFFGIDEDDENDAESL
jgi:hypothetical protein